MKTYIHYGHIVTKPIKNGIFKPLVKQPAKFDKSLFNPIRNVGFVKPEGGYWASPIDTDYGWKDWCEAEDFRTCDENNSFKFTLKEGAKVLYIKYYTDLEGLPRDESMIHLEYGFVTYLDFEKLAEQYDAIELDLDYDYHKLYFGLCGWDCNSILIMNPDIIVPIEEGDVNAI